MQDCRLTVTVRDDKVDFEGQDVSTAELAQIAGYLQVFAGMDGLEHGLDMEDVKDCMLDIHLSAMEALGQLSRGAHKRKG